MELSGLQIFKYLPASKKLEHTNCKECGFPTCMAFSLMLAKHKTDISKCPYAPEELCEIYEHSTKQPQKTVEICGLKIGGENVLYRHEKTFVNRTVMAVVIDMAEPDWKEKFRRAKDFEIKCVNDILKVDLFIIKNGTLPSDVPSVTYEEYKKLPLIEIQDEDFEKTSRRLIEIRKKAVLEKDETYSNPACVYFHKTDNLKTLCAKASYYICKYANMLVFEDFDASMFLALMILRQNIFTDPQRPLQVEGGIYEFNNPDEKSLVFMTTNFALTFFAVANELESLDVPSYLVVIPADGMSVLTAWSSEKLTVKSIANALKKFDFEKKIKTRDIIIPGLLAHMKEELEEELKGFRIIVGTVHAYETKDFVRKFTQV